MIEVFSPGNEDYTKNGDMVLDPIKCDVDAALDSVWSLDLSHPIDELGRWKYITENSVLRVKSFNGEQLFRIKKTQKSDSGIIATARPIWMDAQDEVFIVDIKIYNKTGQEALNSILRNTTKYHATSNITKKATVYYVLNNAVEALMGADNSFLERWGGEILYNNYTIVINDKVGSDKNVDILYGKNIQRNGFEETIDMSDVVTRIVPKAFNGYTLGGNEPWVDSPIANSYPIVMTKVVEYSNIRLEADVSGEDTDGLIICKNMTELRAALRSAAEDEFEKGIDKPKVSIKCDMVLLQNTEEYKDYTGIETVGLGDTVHCNHSKLGIVTDARITKITWDCINEKVRTVTIGETNKTFVDRVASSVRSTEKALTKDGQVIANQIEGIINMGLAQLRYQQDVAKRQEVRAILFEDLDPNSQTFGAMCLGTQGWQISRERTADNTEWIWTTAATSGGIVANVIKAGVLEAIDISGVNIAGSNISGNAISGGTITGSTINNGNGTFQVDQNGNLKASNAEITGDIKSGSTISGSTISGGTIQGATISGNTISGGTISGTSISGGTISGTTISGNTISGGTISGTSISGGTISGASIYSEGPNADDPTRTDSVSINSGSISVGTDDPLYPASTWSADELVFHYFDNANRITKIMSLDVKDLSSGLEITLYNNGSQIPYLHTMRTLVTPYGVSVQRYVSNDFVEVAGSAVISGDSYSTDSSIFIGHVTNASKWIDFYIPMNASAEYLTVNTITARELSVRGVNGYVGGSQYLSNYVISVTGVLRNALRVRLRMTGDAAFTNVTNNTPVSVMGTFVIRFN